MRDPELVARAQRAAARLEAAWEGGRAMQGLADTPAQPVVGYLGYALKEPWGQPRAVIGFSADEAERLAEFLERGSGEYGALDRGAADRGPRDLALDRRAADRNREAAQRHVPDQAGTQKLPAAPVVMPDVMAATSQLPGSQLG